MSIEQKEAPTVSKQPQPSTTRDLASLETELAGLPALIATAAHADDDADLTRLLIRERRLPLQIARLKAEAVSRRIAEVEVEQAAVDADGALAEEDQRTAREAIKQAQAAIKAGEDAFGNARRRAAVILGRREALAGQLAGLRAELTALGA